MFDFDIYDDRFVRYDDATLLRNLGESLGGPSLDGRSRPSIHRRSLATLNELIGILLVAEWSLKHLHVELACVALGIWLWALALRQDHIRRVRPYHILPAWNLIFSSILLVVTLSIFILLDLNKLYILIHSPLRKKNTPLWPCLGIRLLILPLVLHTPRSLSLRVVVWRRHRLIWLRLILRGLD